MSSYKQKTANALKSGRWLRLFCFAAIRHIVTNLYKNMDVAKMSMILKRFRCSFDDDLLYDVIFNKFST